MEEFRIHELFACPVFLKDLNLNNFELEKYALKLKKEQTGNNRSNKGGFQSDFLPFNEEKCLLSLSNSILDCLTHYKNFLGFKKDLEVYIDNMWINVNGEKDYHVSHTHPASVFSGVYYIQAPVNSGNISFEHPSLDTMQYDWLDKHKDLLNEVNSENWYMTSLTGRLLMFPSWLKHNVTPNLTKEYRIALSFNASIKDAPPSIKENNYDVFNDFLTEKDCQNLISYFNKNVDRVKKWGDTEVVDCRDDMQSKDFKNIYDKLNNYTGHQLDWCQVTKWPENAQQDLHLDTAENRTIKSAILYLNDDYSGGQTYFEDGLTITPVKKKALFFKGQEYKHGVKPVKSGNRYTLAVWFKKRDI